MSRPTQVLTRELIASDALREAFRTQSAAPLWPLEQVEASLDAILPRVLTPEGVWVFAYGSLIWNPCIHVAESRVGTIHGRRRSLALVSRFGRGTPERPGLMLSLTRGGSCRGLLLRIDAAHARDELMLLWRREMIAGSYTPRVFRARCDAMPGVVVPAVVFDANTAHPNYCEPMPPAQAARAIAGACGFNGPNADYMHLTQAALLAHGIHDRMMTQLCRLLDALAGQCPAEHSPAEPQSATRSSAVTT